MEGDAGGIRLLAAHLAQIKLQAAEQEYAAKMLVHKLQETLERTADELDESRKDVENYKKQVKQLQGENTQKALIAEREKWRTLVDTLRRDKKELMNQIIALRAKESPEGGPGWRALDNVDGAGNNSPSSVTSPDLLHSCTEKSCVATRDEVEGLRRDLEAREMEVRALRSKLDRELELKWERHHTAEENPGSSGGWQRSLLESFAEVLAPYPTDDEDDDQAFAAPENSLPDSSTRRFDKPEADSTSRAVEAEIKEEDVVIKAGSF